jgi:hypothetical protein
MARRARVMGMESLRRRVLEVLPKAAKDAMWDANWENAQDFAGQVRQFLPVGDPRRGHLVDTLKVEAGEKSETAAVVTIGGPEAPYPLSLETGHRNADGSHTPAQPYWFPARRAVKGKAGRRNGRALAKALQETVK